MKSWEKRTGTGMIPTPPCPIMSPQRVDKISFPIPILYCKN